MSITASVRAAVRADRLRVALLAICAVPIVVYVWIAVHRMGAPLELEWMEGGVVDQVRRAGGGRSLYGPPSLDAVPYIYTPLYYYVCAPVSAVFGTGFLPLRLVSFASSLGAFAALGVLVAKERADVVAGAVAAGVFAACFAIGGAWFDLARVDSLFLALTFAGLAVTRHGTGTRSAAVAGLLMAAAIMTKQQALLPALAPLPYLALSDRARAGVYAVVLAVATGASGVLLQVWSGGWFLRYVVELPASHEVVGHVRRTFWSEDLRPLWLGGAFALVALVVAVRRRRLDLRPLVAFHVPVVVALVAGSYVSRLHSGGYDNVLLPAFAAIAIVFGLGFSAALASPSLVPRAAVAAVLVLQLALLGYDPGAQIPSASQVRRAEALDARLRSLPGPVLMTGHGWYLARAGLQGSAQGAAIEDVLRGAPDARGRALEQQLRGRIAVQHYGAIVVDSNTRLSYLPSNLSEYYRPAGPLFADGRALLPVTGTITGPATVWIPKANGGDDDRAGRSAPR